MNILVYYGKHEPLYWLVDTPTRLNAAQTALFQLLDDNEYYEDNFYDHITVLRDARAGDIDSIRSILENRNGREYETWEIKELKVPELNAIPGRLDLLAFDTYQKSAYALAKYPQDMLISYPALGLAGEAGEVANKVKKIFRDDGGMLTAERTTQIVKELGDAQWYLAAIATDIGVSLSVIAADNLANLYGRKERNTLHGDGDDR